jgi:hypothetical protein
MSIATATGTVIAITPGVNAASAAGVLMLVAFRFVIEPLLLIV